MRCVIAYISLCLSPAILRAGVIVNTTINLTRLDLSPAFGTVQFLSPFTAAADAAAQDSLGGNASAFHSVNDTSTSASAATVLASANSSASVPSRTLTSFSGVGIPNITASASSSAQGALGPAFPTDPNPEQGLFEILDLSNTGQNPVNVNFSVTLHINQFLQTDSAGLSADSEVLFLLNLPDLPDQPLLFFDNPLSIGSNQTQSFLSDPELTTAPNPMQLLTNTPYTLIALVDSESSGNNSVPEPSLFLMTGLGIGVLVASRSRLRHGSFKHRRNEYTQ